MDATAVEATRLATAARERWLNKDEIVFLLLHYKACCGLIPLMTNVMQKPPSGSIFFCSSSMDYRKDGWNWQKKKGSETMVREDRAKLVVNRELVVLGAYAHSADSSIFHRRCYVLRAEEPRIMLVHYLEDSKGKSKATPVSLVQDEPMLMGDMDLFDLTVDSNMSDIYDPPNFQDKDMPPVIPIQTSITIKPLHITDFSPNWDFISGGAKLLICTSETLPSNTQFLVQFGQAVPILAECISSTVLRCTAHKTMQPGYVSLTIVTYCNDTIVPMSEACNFQYKSTRATFEEDDGTIETKSMSSFSEALSMKRTRDDDATSIYSDRSSSSS
ncbi:calmodulin-binding transcription activator, partial [Thraustotheca clavata]